MIERASVLALVSIILSASVGAHAAQPNAPSPCPRDVTAVIDIQGALICLYVDPSAAKQQSMVLTWVDRSAHIVAGYYGRFTAPRVLLQVRSMDGEGVGGGRTTNDGELMIQVRVGRDATPGGLLTDWVLVHEMIHLALPEIGRRHLWLAEGLATYVEGVARAQSGNRDVADVWAEDLHSMPKGLPHAGEGGMDQTSNWGRTYWGGALFCLEADVGIRETTGNRAGLQTALRAILLQGGGYGQERDIETVLKIGDAATGTRVLQDLYQRRKAAPEMTDLDALWRRLGVPDDPTTQPFDEHAPLAAIRRAITARP